MGLAGHAVEKAPQCIGGAAGGDFSAGGVGVTIDELGHFARVLDVVVLVHLEEGQRGGIDRAGGHQISIDLPVVQINDTSIEALQADR